MLLLHVSDIHFRWPDCLDEATDQDHVVRTRVANHLRDRVDEMGPVDAILVGGDVAFSGHPDEYAAATRWLTELAGICGCSPTNRLFVVPGNHDVDRAIAGRHVGLQNAQHRLSRTPLADRERALRRQLADAGSGRDLFAAHVAYNNFAAPLNCQIYPSRLFWHQDVEMGGGVMLRINGLTSTLLSGRDGEDDVERDLYLSPLQTAFDPVEDRVHLALCHHPVDWLADGDAVDDDMNARARFQLFGHKHRQRIVPTPGYLRVMAGAVNPSRKEPGWEPGYNLLRIDVEGAGPERKLRYETHQFRYQRAPEGFVPVLTEEGADHHVGTVRFPGRVRTALTGATPAAGRAATIPHGSIEAVPAGEQPAPIDDVEASMGDEARRDIIHRFWAMPGHRRREVMLSLGLIGEAELAIDEPERYGMAFLRAGERNQLDVLAELIDRDR
ncbi:metallophosphoesterase [uncultured Aureimonas sp.]|uniref:metallophosphoesterase n=1 Tax=uncultured Aureimonas sp. TaxID=1604662 RepID=UPI0025CF4C01|nr:metallophosphoesterase [uncultured Aureimonas sp.]